MVELKKIKNEIGCFDIRITTENAMFMMFFGGNGDLHWSVFDLENMWTDQVDIVITRENNVLYEIFSDLYNRVKECEIYRVSDLELDSCDAEEEKDVIRNRVIKKNNDVKKNIVIIICCLVMTLFRGIVMKVYMMMLMLLTYIKRKIVFY